MAKYTKGRGKTLRKISLAGIIAAVCLSFTVSAGAVNAPAFSDVSANSSYYEATQWAVEQKIVSGTGSQRFVPERKITTDEFIAMFMRTYYPGFQFNNNTSKQWKDYYVHCAEAINLFYDEEYAKMKQDGITRQQIWMYLMNETDLDPCPTWMYTGETPEINNEKDIETAMYTTGLYSQKVDTKATPTRGEVVQLLYRLQNHLYTKQQIPKKWEQNLDISIRDISGEWKGRNAVFYDLTILPEKYKTMLRKGGWSIELVSQISRYYPKYPSAQGICLPNEKKIMIGCNTFNAQGVLLHEIGHVLTHETDLGFFISHMYKEIENISKVTGSSYAKTNSGEMFAEVFRFLLSYPNDERRIEWFKEAAPYTYYAVTEGILEANGLVDTEILNGWAAYYWDYLYNGEAMPPRRIA